MHSTVGTDVTERKRRTALRRARTLARFVAEHGRLVVRGPKTVFSAANKAFAHSSLSEQEVINNTYALYTIR